MESHSLCSKYRMGYKKIETTNISKMVTAVGADSNGYHLYCRDGCALSIINAKSSYLKIFKYLQQG